MKLDKYDVDPPPLLDFTSISRGADKAGTAVSVYMGYERSEWMKLGLFQLVPKDRQHSRGVWLFEALIDNATDYSHSAARLIRMDLVGVEMSMHLYGQTIIEGFVGGDVESFRVPPADYDPRFHPKATRCNEPDCTRGGTDHVIVPEGFYVPPVNEELLKIVVGRRIEIRTWSL